MATRRLPTMLSTLFLLAALVSVSCGCQNWNRTCGGAYDVAYSADVTTDGGYVIAGGNGIEPARAAVAKLDADGTVLWHHEFAGAQRLAYCVKETKDGRYTVAVADIYTGSSGYDGGRVALGMLDSDGNELWELPTLGAGLSLSLPPAGGYVLAGANVLGSYLDPSQGARQNAWFGYIALP